MSEREGSQRERGATTVVRPEERGPHHQAERAQRMGWAERRLAARADAPPLWWRRRRTAARTRAGRWLERHLLVRRLTRLLAGTAIAGVALLTLPGTANAVPVLGGCTTPPVPEAPGQGISGFFLSAPNPPPGPEDPFKPGAKTTPFEQYGLAGLSWYSYDLGCGGTARDPSGAISTWTARTLFIPAKAGVAALVAVSQAALHPTYLSAFDPLLKNLTDALNKAIFTPIFPLAVMLTGLLLMAQATRQRVAESTTAIGWCVLVTVMAAALFAWPVRAGHAADSVITTGVGVVARGITGNGGQPGQQVASSLYGPFLYRMWLMGEFCDPDSPGAKAHGSDLLRAQALSWNEAAQAGPNGEQITKDKQARFDEVAGRVKKDDPTAYECVAGHGSSALEAAILADVGVLLMAPFLLIGGLILIAAYIIIRFAVILAPALLTAGAFFPLRGVVVAAARVVAAAILNGLLFTLAVLLVIRVDTAILAPTTALPSWLRLVLVGVVTVVMWYLTRPFRKLTTMVTSGGFAMATGDGGYESRRFGGLIQGLRRRDEPGVINSSDNDTTMVVVNNPRLREEARGPVGAVAAVAAGRRAGRHRSPPISVESTRMDDPAGRVHLYKTGTDTRPELPAAGTAAETGTGPLSRTGQPARRGAPAVAGTRAGGWATSSVAGATAGATAGAAAMPARPLAPAAAATAGRGGGYAGRATAGPPVGQQDPEPAGVHHPPLPPGGRRAVDRTARQNDAGLYDASDTYRPAPEDDHQGYLRPVRPELDDDDLYRLFDPSRDRAPSEGSTWSR
jgi:hypothetical protein